MFLFFNDILIDFCKKIIGLFRKLPFLKGLIDSYCLIYGWEKKDKIRIQNIDLPKLSKNASTKINSFWNQFFHKPIKDTYYRTIVYILGKEPENLHLFISPYILHVHIIDFLNPPSVVKTFSEKLLLPLLFPSVKQPRIIIGYYHGLFINENYIPISLDEAIEIITNYGDPIILKPSIDSNGGKGVMLCEKYDETILKTIFDTYKTNFVVQEVIEQSPDLAIFNSTSLNTIRITTLLINGKCSVLSKMFRHGGPNMKVDNMSSGGFGVGISDDGSLTFASSDTGELRRDVHISGIKYSKHKIPNFKSICQIAIRMHFHTPQCCMIGWDFALDKNNTPTLIEANYYHPEVTSQQILEGKPIFGDRIQEVLDYCFKKKLKKR